jgi:Icc-related predicted phosphoesterase
MKICIISDTHRKYGKVILPEGADILISCGDIGILDYMDLIDYNDWLGTQKHKFKYTIQIAGNHDLDLEKRGIREIEEILTNCIYLENCGVELEGIKFWGSPITPFFNDWAFMKYRGEEIKRYWDMIPDDTNVLITHGPAYGILDQTLMANGDPGERVGCFDLLNRIKQLEKLKLHCFGHIHGQYGTYNREGVKFVNASLVNEEYELVNEPIVVGI